MHPQHTHTHCPPHTRTGPPTDSTCCGVMSHAPILLPSSHYLRASSRQDTQTRMHPNAHATRPVRTPLCRRLFPTVCQLCHASEQEQVQSLYQTAQPRCKTQDISRSVGHVTCLSFPSQPALVYFHPTMRTEHVLLRTSCDAFELVAFTACTAQTHPRLHAMPLACRSRDAFEVAYSAAHMARLKENRFPAHNLSLALPKVPKAACRSRDSFEQEQVAFAALAHPQVCVKVRGQPQSTCPVALL